MLEKFRYCVCERLSESGSLILIYNRDTLQMRNFQRRTMLYKHVIHYAQMFTLWLIRLYTLKFDLFFLVYFPLLSAQDTPIIGLQEFWLFAVLGTLNANQNVKTLTCIKNIIDYHIPDSIP